MFSSISRNSLTAAAALLAAQLPAGVAHADPSCQLIPDLAGTSITKVVGSDGSQLYGKLRIAKDCSRQWQEGHCDLVASNAARPGHEMRFSDANNTGHYNAEDQTYYGLNYHLNFTFAIALRGGEVTSQRWPYPPTTPGSEPFRPEMSEDGRYTIFLPSNKDVGSPDAKFIVRQNQSGSDQAFPMLRSKPQIGSGRVVGIDMDGKLAVFSLYAGNPSHAGKPLFREDFGGGRIEAISRPDENHDVQVALVRDGKIEVKKFNVVTANIQDSVSYPFSETDYGHFAGSSRTLVQRFGDEKGKTALLRDGQTTVVWNPSGSPLYDVGASPDGKLVVLDGSDGASGMYLVLANAGTGQVSVNHYPHVVSMVDILDDTHALVSPISRTDSRLDLVDLESGETRNVIDRPDGGSFVKNDDGTYSSTKLTVTPKFMCAGSLAPAQQALASSRAAN